MEANTNSNNDTINIIELLLFYLKLWWIFIIVGVVGAFGTLGAMLVFTQQEYSASAKMYVNNSSSFSDTVTDIKNTLTTGDLSAAKSIVDLYCIIIETRSNMDKVCERCNNIERYYPELNYTVESFGHERGYEYNYENLIEKIEVKSVNSTEIFEITMESKNDKEAIFIVNVIASIAERTISDIIDGSSAKCIDEAQVATPVSRGLATKTIIGFLVGILLTGIVLFVYYYFNDTITSDDFLKNAYKDKIPLLATIPDSVRGVSSKHNYGYHKYGYYNYYESKDKDNN